MRARRAGVSLRAPLILLVVLTLTGMAAIVPTGAAARGNHDGDPGTYQPGNGGGPDTGVTGGGGSATVTTDLNLRAGPGTDTAVLTVMPAGAVVEIAGDPENGFYPVNY